MNYLQEYFSLLKYAKFEKVKSILVHVGQSSGIHESNKFISANIILKSNDLYYFQSSQKIIFLLIIWYDF